MKRLSSVPLLILSIIALGPFVAFAQDTAPRGPSESPTAAVALSQEQGVPAQGAQEAVKSAVKKFNIGVEGGVALDPELITFGAYGRFGPVFSPAVAFRPGIYFAFGEVTTELGFDLDVLYTVPGASGTWHTYIGGGPNFALSHKGFEEPADSTSASTTSTTTANGTTTTTTTRSRFDFGDTSFDAGFNFIVGARRDSGVFFEMKATAYGVANVKLLAGFSF